MKGTSFQKPLELNIQIDGESWRQGETLKGSLTAKTHAKDPLGTNAFLEVSLAHGQLKKVHAKSPDAFSIIVTKKFNSTELIPGKDLVLDWSFPTDRNVAITDNSGSLFILYGVPGSQGHLQLTFHPYETIDDFVKILETDFRYIQKTKKFNKGKVEVKFAPPQSKGFAALENMVVSFSYDREVLKVSYLFNLQKVEASAASIGVKKEKKTFQQEFLPTQCRTPSGRLNHEQLEIGIKQALDEVRFRAL